jgi:hypothetical protein
VEKMTGQKEVECESVFIKKIVKSRNSFLIWVPKDEAEFLDFKDGDFVHVKLKKLDKEIKNKSISINKKLNLKHVKK